VVHRRPGQGITSWGTLLPQNLPQKPKIGRIGQRAGHARWPAGSRLPTGHTGVVRAQAEARALADLSSALATSRIGMWGYTAVPEDRCICFYCTLTLPSLWISVFMCLSVSLFICLSVCPVAYLVYYVSKRHQIFLHGLPMAMARSSDGSAVRYVLPVLWMTSCFHAIDRMSQNQKHTIIIWNKTGHFCQQGKAFP